MCGVRQAPRASPGRACMQVCGVLNVALMTEVDEQKQWWGLQLRLLAAVLAQHVAAAHLRSKVSWLQVVSRQESVEQLGLTTLQVREGGGPRASACVCVCVHVRVHVSGGDGGSWGGASTQRALPAHAGPGHDVWLAQGPQLLPRAHAAGPALRHHVRDGGQGPGAARRPDRAAAQRMQRGRLRARRRWISVAERPGQ